METQPTLRITKQFGFESAHALWNYDGACSQIHGHSYILWVTIKGHPIDDATHPNYGMVMDFSKFKSLINNLIIKPLDHALMVNAHTPHAELSEWGKGLGKVVKLPYQPTCENMVVDFANKIKAALPPDVDLVRLKLQETASSYAEWLAEDNM